MRFGTDSQRWFLSSRRYIDIPRHGGVTPPRYSKVVHNHYTTFCQEEIWLIILLRFHE